MVQYYGFLCCTFENGNICRIYFFSNWYYWSTRNYYTKAFNAGNGDGMAVHDGGNLLFLRNQSSFYGINWRIYWPDVFSMNKAPQYVVRKICGVDTVENGEEQ